MGLNVAVELRARTGRGGSADTTSGSSRDFTVRSIAATSARGAKESIGAQKTRTASLVTYLASRRGGCHSHRPADVEVAVFGASIRIGGHVTDCPTNERRLQLGWRHWILRYRRLAVCGSGV